MHVEGRAPDPGAIEQLLSDAEEFFEVMATGHFARGIDRRLAELPRGRGLAAERRAALAHAPAGALLSLLSWWLGRDMPESPAAMDDPYHWMVWAGVNEP